MVYQYRQASSQGRLNARPGQPGAEPIAVGLHPLGLGSPRDGLLYVPEDYQRNHPVPLVLLFHGAGGSARGSLDVFLPSLKPSGCLFLAPDSRATTWDLIEEGGYASDAAFLDRALAHIFQRFTIDETHLAIGGFSDGASYALSLGLTNGDFFTHLVGFSPGFLSPARLRGKPRIYISHGIHDAVLPIERCSRKIVPRLLQEHYDVHYREFDGPHTVPMALIHEAWNWFLGASEQTSKTSEKSETEP